MKKSIILILIAAMLLCALGGCASEPAANPSVNTSTEASDDATESTVTDESGEDDGFQLNIADEKVVRSYTADGITWEMPPVAKGAGATVLPLSTTGETLSVFRTHTTFDHSISSPSQIKANQVIEEKTGITIDWQVYSETEQFNLMIASQDYADMIWASGSAYVGGTDKAVEDEVYVNAADYFELTPNYVALLESDREIYNHSTTDNHNFYFTSVNSGVQGSFMGPMIRADWLEELGLEMPKTYEDWFTVLASFRDQKAVQDPLIIASQTGAEITFTAGYNTYPGFYAENGTTVKYGYTDDNMRDYVAMMQTWYQENLLFHDFLSNTDGMIFMNASIAGTTGSATSGYYGFADVLTNMISGSKFVGTPLPKQNADDEKLHFRGAYNSLTTDLNIYISTGAVERGTDELAAKWIDYRYSEECSIILYYGVEGESWSWGEDGLPHIIAEPWLSNVFNGEEYEEFGSVWTDSSVCYGTYVWLIRICDQNTEEGMQPIITWSDSADTDWIMPSVSMTTQEGELYRETYGDIETYVLENFAKFIVGEKPLTEWDEYVATIENMGIQDCIDCYQSALDRYNAR